ARLPQQFRESLREMAGMLARPARNLQHQPALGQDVAQHVDDRPGIARDMRRGATIAFAHQIAPSRKSRIRPRTKAAAMTMGNREALPSPPFARRPIKNAPMTPPPSPKISDSAMKEA